MRQTTIIKVYLHQQSLTTNDEARVIRTFATVGSEIAVRIWPVGGSLQAQVYGQEINEMLNMIYEGDIDVGDGIRIYDSIPDYLVLSKKKYSRYTCYELKKI